LVCDTAKEAFNPPADYISTLNTFAQALKDNPPVTPTSEMAAAIQMLQDAAKKMSVGFNIPVHDVKSAPAQKLDSAPAQDVKSALVQDVKSVPVQDFDSGPAQNTDEQPGPSKPKKSKKSKKHKRKSKNVGAASSNPPSTWSSSAWNFAAENRRKAFSIFESTNSNDPAVFENFELAGRKLYAFIYSIERDPDQLREFQTELKRAETLIDMIDAKIGAALYGIKRLDVKKAMEKEKRKEAGSDVETAEELSDMEERIFGNSLSKKSEIEEREFGNSLSKKSGIEVAEHKKFESEKSEESEPVSKKVTFHQYVTSKETTAPVSREAYPVRGSENSGDEDDRSSAEDYVEMHKTVSDKNAATVSVNFDLTGHGKSHSG
jgi:hypothetical protein